MNRTLLLIIVDFLFLNLIALTRWDRAEPARNAQPPVPEVAANAPSKGDDLVEAMRQSLTDEQASRQDLAQKLAFANTALTAREQNLSAAEAQKAQLASSLTVTQKQAADLSQKFTEASQQAALSRDQLAQILRELDEKNAEAGRQREALAVLARQQADSQKQIAGLTMAVVVGETEKKQLQDKADALQTQVQTERDERAMVEQNSAQLAQGVGQLAQKSGELTKEIRDNRPINPNTLYNDFLTNQVDTTFTGTRKGLFGKVDKTKTTPTIFVTDGTQVYGLLHVSDSVFSFALDSDNWNQLSVSFERPSGYHGNAKSVAFLASDPRALAIPVDAAQVTAMGVKVYALAADPFRFPEAVLISGRGKGYGAVTFKLDAAHPGYVRVDNRLFKRLFGDFAPSRGDLVFSQSGELLGLMVNSDYCVLIKDFAAASTIQTGADTASEQTGSTLNSFYSRIMAMAPELQ